MSYPKHRSFLKSALLLITLSVFGSLSAQAAVVLASSDFSTGADGWTLVGDPTSPTPTYYPSGGSDGNGYIHGKDKGLGDIWYWNAPAHFLGNKSSAYNTIFSYDERLRGAGGQIVARSDLILYGAGLSLHFYTGATPHHTNWTSYEIPLLAASGWKVNSMNGAAASEEQLQSVLSDLSALWIRGEFTDGYDDADLDNVVMRSSATVPEPAALPLLLGLLGLFYSRRRPPVAPR